MSRPRTVSPPLPKPAWASRVTDANTKRAIQRRLDAEASREALKPLPEPKPEVIKPVLYPFQVEAADFHIKHRYSLNCSEMGLGKSIMALEAASRTELKVAVFGPVFLARTWEKEAAKMGVEISYFPYTQISKVKEEILSKFKFWIADEIHYLKNPSAKRTELFYERMKHCLPEYFIGMTGTPIKNRVPDFWTLLAFCNLCPQDTIGRRLDGRYKGYYKFASHFCHVVESYIRGNFTKKFVGIKEENLEELRNLLRGKYIKFTVDKVLPSLPEMTRKHIDLGRKSSPDLQEIFEAYQQGNKSESSAKAKSALLKAPDTADYCNSIIEETGEPIIVYTDHIESAKFLNANISNSFLCMGSTDKASRLRLEEEFQGGKYDAIVATIGALSVGVTLTRARHVVFNDISWTPADNLQAEKRIHRIGQKSACFAHYINSSPTDRAIFNSVWSKLETINEVMNE
jgi:SWI/SNF-related matrix-associated actin-dependent regulator 1 of chromatin subfamily A